MKKRILTMLLAVLMIVPALLTSCSSEEGEAQAQVDAKRSKVVLTLYAITDKKTTKDAIAEVQEEVNRLTYLRYKTELELRFFTADKYQEAIDAAQKKYDEIAASSIAASESVEASKKAAKAEEKNMTPEELRKKKQEERLAAKESIRLSKAEEQARLDRIEKGEELPPNPVTEHQMDLLFIESFDKLVEMIDAERLLPLDSYLAENYTILSDYIQPAVMAGVTNAGNGKTYAIPTNSIVTPEGSFMLFKKSYVDKHSIDLSKVKKLSDVTPILAAIKAAEPTILPVQKPVTTIAEYNFFGADGAPIGVMNTESDWLNLSGQAEQFTTSNSAMKDHFNLMYKWRMSGYFTTGPAYTDVSTYEEMKVGNPADANADYFMTVVEGSYYDIEKWENEGYYVVTHKSPEYTTENSLKTFYGIYAGTAYADRAMEILKMMTTDSQLKNTLQYGIQDVHYSLNDDKTTVTFLKDDYVMDFYGTGNTFIGYIPEEMGSDYLSKALEMSKHARINGFIGFDPRFDEETEALYQEMTEATAEIYQRLLDGTDRVIPVMREAEKLLEACCVAKETTALEIVDAFNDLYKPCLKLLNEQSRLIRPTNDVVYDFISDMEAAGVTVAPSSAAASTAAK